MGQTFNEDLGTFGVRPHPVNSYVAATGQVLNARDRALAGGPGAPNVSDVIRLRNQNAQSLTGPQPQPVGIPNFTGPPAAASPIAPPAGNPSLMAAGGFRLSPAQLAQMRDAALSGQANPLFPTIPGTGAGTPNVSDIIRAQQTTYLPYNRGG